MNFFLQKRPIWYAKESPSLITGQEKNKNTMLKSAVFKVVEVSQKFGVKDGGNYKKIDIRKKKRFGLP